MKQIRMFIKTSVIGGLIVLLPVGILLIAFNWVFGLIRSAIRPLTDLLVHRSDLQEYAAIVVVLWIIIATCFLVGVVVQTQIGRFLHQVIESRILKVAPGYSLVKQTVLQFMGGGGSPFGTVAIIQLFDSSTRTLGFVTERHADGSFTVFVPTAPNPTSGLIYIVPARCVQIVKHPVEDVMRSIISCGAGSATVLRSVEETVVAQQAIS